MFFCLFVFHCIIYKFVFFFYFFIILLLKSLELKQTSIQQGCIKWIKRDSKYIYNVTNDAVLLKYLFNKVSWRTVSFIHLKCQIINSTEILNSTIVFNIDNNNKCCSNDAENSALPSEYITLQKKKITITLLLLYSTLSNKCSLGENKTSFKF